jgi:hypothetical protein
VGFGISVGFEVATVFSGVKVFGVLRGLDGSIAGAFVVPFVVAFAFDGAVGFSAAFALGFTLSAGFFFGLAVALGAMGSECVGTCGGSHGVCGHCRRVRQVLAQGLRLALSVPWCTASTSAKGKTPMS